MGTGNVDEIISTVEWGMIRRRSGGGVDIQDIQGQLLQANTRMSVRMVRFGWDVLALLPTSRVENFWNSFGIMQ
jgi:hypothetical protein